MENKRLVIHSRQDIIDFVSTNPVSQKGMLIVLVALGGIILDAYDLTSLGIGVNQLTEDFHLSPTQLGSLTSVMAVGALLGALFGGMVTDKLGRNKMFLVDILLLVVAAFGAALAPNLAVLVFFRFLLGVGIGLDVPIALSFIAEITNTKRRGQLVNLWSPVWYIATAFAGLLLLPIYFLGIDENLWRYAVGFGGVLALIVLFLRFKFMDESPIWAAKHLPLQQAAKIVERTYNIEVVVQELKQKVIKKDEKVALSTLFSKKYRMRTLSASILAATESMEYFAVMFYLPTISMLIFGKGTIYGIIGTVVFNCCGILGGLFQSYLTGKVGIRKLAIIGYSIVCIALLTVGLLGKSLPTILVAILIGGFIFGHAFGPGAQCMTMATLSYPTELRGLGSGWGQAMLRVGSIIGAFVFPMVLALAGLEKTLLVVLIAPIIGLIAVSLIKWDPTNMNLDSDTETDFPSKNIHSTQSELNVR